jgi:hypothetical protein
LLCLPFGNAGPQAQYSHRKIEATSP